jgi:hypothetical protein
MSEHLIWSGMRGANCCAVVVNDSIFKPLLRGDTFEGLYIKQHSFLSEGDFDGERSDNIARIAVQELVQAQELDPILVFLSDIKPFLALGLVCLKVLQARILPEKEDN